MFCCPASPPPLHHSSSLGHFSFEAPPSHPTSLPHQFIHHTESLWNLLSPHPSFSVAATALPLCLKLFLQAKASIALLLISASAAAAAAAVKLFHPIHNFNPPSVSSSCQSSTAPFSFQVTAHNRCEASGFSPCLSTGWDLRAGLLRIGNCGLFVCWCVTACRLELLFKSKCCLLLQALESPPSHLGRFPAGGLLPPARGSLPPLQLILHQKYTMTPLPLPTESQNYEQFEWICAFRIVSPNRNSFFFLFLLFILHTISKHSPHINLHFPICSFISLRDE